MTKETAGKKLSKPSIYFITLLTASLISLFIYIINPFENGKFSSESATKIYFTDHISDIYKELIGEFNKSNKGKIEVIPVHLPFEKFTTNERKEILSRYLRSNDMVDIVSIDQIWVPRFAKWAQPLDTYFRDYLKDSLLSIALKSCYYKEHLVAIPIHIDIAMMYYRKDLINQLPDHVSLTKKLKESISWEEFIQLGKKYNSKIPFYIFQADDYEGLVCSFLEILQGQGKNLYENGRLQLNSPEAYKALQMLVDLVNKHKISPPVVSTFRENSSNNYFIKNNGIFLRGWPSFLKEFEKDSLHKGIVENLEIAALPHFKNKKPIYVLGGWDFMVSKYSNHKKEAVKFIKFMISRQTQKRIFEARQTLPVNEGIYKEENYLAENKNLAFAYQLLNNGFCRPFIEDYTKVSDIISYYLYLAIKKQISAEDALKKASEKIYLGQVLIR